MANSKIYLNVSFAEKDKVKALGGRWDPAKKKWYIATGLDSTPFVKWQPELSTLGAKSKGSTSNKFESPLGVITHPTDKNFIAYNGEEPPWE